jgi:TolB protein
MNAVDGSGVTQLTTDTANDRLPNWSADDMLIVFTSDRVTSENNIYTMNANDGSGIAQLTTNGSDDNSPDWKPAP